MKVCKQLAVFVANRPGTLAQVSKVLAQEGINILGLSVADAVDHAVLRLIVSDPNRAIHLLEDAGLLVLDTDVLALRLQNTAGNISKLSEALANENINIAYAYGGLDENNSEGTLYLKVSDTERAKEVISQLKL
jgi:hypothetical protein